MPDDSELDYIRTFLGKVHTVATVKQISEVKNISLINDTQRILVYPGEIIKTDYNYFVKRYLVKISETSEANLTTALNNIIDGINKLNKREAITEYTKPGVLVGAELVNSNKPFENSQTKRWDLDINIDFEWVTS